MSQVSRNDYQASTVYNPITNPIPNYNRNPYLSKVNANANRYNTINTEVNDVRESKAFKNAAALML